MLFIIISVFTDEETGTEKLKEFVPDHTRDKRKIQVQAVQF